MLGFRRWGIGLGVVVLALCMFVPVLGKLKKASGGPSFSVMTYNILDLGGKRPAIDKVASVIRDAGVPDVVLLQEVRGENMAASLSDMLNLPYHVYQPARGQPYGLSILSRYPLIELEFLYYRSSKTGRGALKATVLIDGRKVRVCTVHLDRIDSIPVDPCLGT